MDAQFLNNRNDTTSQDIVYFPTMMPYLICPALSSLASSAMLVLLLISKFYQEAIGVMLICINIADLLFCAPKAITFFIRPWDNFACRIVQFISHSGLISSAIWGFLFAHAMLKVISFQKFDIIRNLLKPYIIASVLLPIMLSAQCLFSDFVIYKSDTCVHTVITGEMDLKNFLFTALPIVICCTLSIVWYTFAGRLLKNFMHQNNTIYTWTLVVYPAIFLICWMPSILTNGLIMLGMAPNPTLLAIFQALDQTQGFWNAVIYGLSRGSVRNALKRIICCRRPQSEAITQDSMKISLVASDSDSNENDYSDTSPLAHSPLTPLTPN